VEKAARWAAAGRALSVVTAPRDTMVGASSPQGPASDQALAESSPAARGGSLAANQCPGAARVPATAESTAAAARLAAETAAPDSGRASCIQRSPEARRRLVLLGASLPEHLKSLGSPEEVVGDGFHLVHVRIN